MYQKITFLCFVLILFSQENVIEIKNLDPRSTYEKTFELISDATLDFFAIAPQIGSEDRSSAVWILDVETRKVVWELEDATSNRSKRRGIREFTDEIFLAKGYYKIFFTTHTEYSVFNGKGGIFESLSKLFDGDRLKSNMRSRDVRYLELTLKGRNITEISNNRQFDSNKHIIFQKIKMKDDYYKKIAFKVSERTSVEIYAIGEVFRKYGSDYARIVDADTKEEVWALKYRNSEHAGGGTKNRMFKGQIRLKPGEYILTAISDDSHSYQRWNVAPPYDQEYWGITVSVDREHKDNIEIIDPNEVKDKNVVLKITEVRRNETLANGLHLKKDMTLRIYALGEGYSDLTDYGWIIDFKTGKYVWDMQKERNTHAGGARKNRLVEDEIFLRKGKYIVGYRTDDSHDFGHWNDRAPDNPEYWGISIYTRNDEDKSYVSTFEPYKIDNIIVRITRVRDSEDESYTFRLKESKNVSIYAIGEGDNDEMYDYGFIRKKSGRRVWRMRYGDTVHAGGARKNRLVRETIFLEAGEYVLSYVSDDSHSYQKWNDSPPNDPDNYGITLFEYSE